MPSKTPKQAKFMRAIAHGWKPSRMKSPPSRAVAQEFVEADKKYSGGFAENRYWTGGLAQMSEPNSGIDETLNWLKGGPVNYYQEGGAARPGHAEGPNPYNEADPLLRKSYARWERKHHIEPPPPPEAEAVVEAEPQEIPWWQKLMGYEAGPTKTEEALEALGEAHGGRVGYQTGGLAMAAPAGGVPPWIQPTGAGPGGMLPPGYAEEPQGYQFGGAASRFGGARGRMPYRGVPPQRGRIQRGAPRGGGRGGALQRAMMQMRQQRGAPGGRGRVGLSPYEQMENQRRGPRGPMGPGGGGGPLQLPPGGWLSGPNVIDENPIVNGRPLYGGPGGPGGGGIPPWKQPPGRRIAPPPGKQPGGGMMYPGGSPTFDESGGGGIPGGPRVPPNMQGYLQKMRMQNRPPSGPVGGGGNRVGMQDQQGGLSRALQRGTGRPPMSRRSSFPGRDVR